MTCIADKLTKKAAATGAATVVGAGLGAGAGYGLGSALDFSTTGKILAALGGGVAGGAAGHAVGSDYDKYKDDTGTKLPWAEARKGELYTAGGAAAGAGLGYAVNRFVGRNTDAVSALGSILAGGGLGALAGNLYHSGVLADGEKRLVDEAAKRGITYGSEEWNALVKDIEADETGKNVPLWDKYTGKATTPAGLTTIGLTTTAALEASRAVRKMKDFEAFKNALRELDPKKFESMKTPQLEDLFWASRQATRGRMTVPELTLNAVTSVVPGVKTPYRGVTAKDLQGLVQNLNSAAPTAKTPFLRAIGRALKVTL